MALILWQTEWGHAFLREPPAEPGVAAKPMTVSLLPEYQPLAAPDGNRDVVERTLFNPTRRPAPDRARRGASRRCSAASSRYRAR